MELFPPILHWQDGAAFQILSNTKQCLYREPEGAIALLLPTIAGENRRVLLERLQNRKVKEENAPSWYIKPLLLKIKPYLAWWDNKFLFIHLFIYLLSFLLRFKRYCVSVYEATYLVLTHFSLMFSSEFYSFFTFACYMWGNILCQMRNVMEQLYQDLVNTILWYSLNVFLK